MRAEQAYVAKLRREGFEFENEGKDWAPPSVVDIMLNGFYDEMPVYGKENSLIALCGRNPWAIKRKIWGVGTAYGSETKPVKFHEPSKLLKDRRGKPWNSREHHMILLATGKHGRARGADNFEYISTILSRDLEEVRRHMKKIAAQAPVRGFFPGPLIDCVHEELQRNADNSDFLKQLEIEKQKAIEFWEKEECEQEEKNC